MEFRQIRYFLEVARLGSFSKASMHLNVAQPVLSRHIKRLEEELSAPLFYRDGRGAQLTHVGETFHGYASSIASTLHEAEEEVRLLSGTPSGNAIVGLPPSVGRVLSVPLALNLRQRYPNLSLRIVEGFSGHILEWLQSGRIDIAVLYEEASMRPGLIAEPLVAEDLYAFGHPDDFRRIDAALPPGQPPGQPPGTPRDTPGGTIAFRDLGDVPLVLPSRPHGLRLYLDECAIRLGVKLDVNLEVDALHTTMEAVRARIGIAIMPKAAMSNDLLGSDLEARKIVDPVLTRNLFVVTGAKRPDFASDRELVRLVKTVTADLLDAGTWRPISDQSRPGQAGHATAPQLAR